LINVQKWREEEIQSKLIECYKENFDKLLWADQDVMNLLFRGRWLLLDPKYNSLRQFQYEPFVVHFNTSSKPWHLGDDNKWTRSYMNNRIYFEKDWLPLNTSFKTILKSFAENTTEYYFNFRFTIKLLVLQIRHKISIKKSKFEKRQ
jgi:lipopolysaccharide biosynthesis glycosyltransferase